MLVSEIKWEYKTEDQYTNVNAVCVQVKGQILHNLGKYLNINTTAFFYLSDSLTLPGNNGTERNYFI